MAVKELKDYPIDGGRYLIEANAGTGKTYTIVNLVLRLIVEREIPVNRIIVTTFSNAAATELKERISAGLEQALREAVSDSADDGRKALLLQLALASLDEAMISTIHGFCQKMLRDFVLESGIGFERKLVGGCEEYKEQLLREVLRKLFYSGSAGKYSSTDLNPEVIAKALPYSDVPASPESANDVLSAILEYIHLNINKLKADEQVLSFDDLIGLLTEALRRNPVLAGRIRSRYDAVFVDEFQDTDKNQFEIFDLCFPMTEKGKLFYMIGDPKQAIYRFRGGDIYAYLAAKEQLSKDHVFEILTNFRSSSGAIEAINLLFAGSQELVSENVFLQRGIPYHPVKCGKPGCFRFFENGQEVTAGLRLRAYNCDKKSDPRQILRDTVQEIVSLLSRERQVEITGIDAGGQPFRRPISASDIAVLLPRHQDIDKFKRALQLQGIAGSACRSGKIFNSDEAIWFTRLLELWLAPGGTGCRHLMLSPFFRIPCTALEEIPLGSWLKKFRECLELWRNSGLPAAFSFFMDSRFEGVAASPREMVLTGKNGERTMTNFLQIVDLLHSWAVPENHAPESVLEHLRALCSGTVDLENGEESADEHPDELRLEGDSAAVQLITMHAAKGLEFPVVFLPSPVSTSRNFLISRKARVFLSRDKSGRNVTAIGGGDYRERAKNEMFSEQLRLLYVGLTRAKNLTYLYLQVPEQQLRSGNQLRKEAVTGRSVNYYDSAVGALTLAIDQSSPEERLRAVTDGRLHEAVPAPWFEALCLKSENRFGPIEYYTDGVCGQLIDNQEKISELEAREKVKVPHCWQMMSFSKYGYGGRGAGQAEDIADRDEESPSDPVPEETLPEENSGASFLAFPRGKTAGTLVHGVLEQLAKGILSSDGFAALADGRSRTRLTARLSGLLEKGRYDSVLQLPRLFDGLSRTLCTPLPEIGCALCEISPKQCIAETEFYLDGCNSLTLNKLIALLQGYASPKLRNGFTLPEDTGEINGILNGAIDLVFEHQGKFWIVDWKTNYLGGLLHDYRRTELARTMSQKGYLLQAYLYSAALLRMLEQRGFEDNAFGGVFYLFLRGVDADGGGIWFDRPPVECLHRMLELFQGRR